MLKFNKVLLASDFDNTLVYTQGALERGEDIPPMSARNREAVEYFIRNGGYFSISTGRALPAFARYAQDLPCNAPCVIANGAAIYDFNKDCYVETAFLDADIYDHVDALLARFPGLCFEIYHDDRRIHVLHPNDYTRNHEHLTRAKTEEVKDFREVDLPIIKLLFEEEKPLLDEVRDFIRAQDGVVSLDTLRTRKFGSKVYIDAEISVDGSMTLSDAHSIAERVHNAVEHKYPDIKHIMIHENPASASAE